MIAKDLVEILLKSPLAEVVILESGKHNDNIPYLRILSTYNSEYENNEGDNINVIELLVECNLETVLG